MTDNPGRKAVTLVELLVASAIIGVLIALAAPAIQRARDIAARAQCANNLHEIGIGLHSYHGILKAFPPGVSYDNGADPFPFMSWNARILPFIDQEPLWQITVAAYEQGNPLWMNPPHVGFQTVMPIYACPGNPTSLSQAGPVGRYAAFTSYLGVEGTDQFFKDGVLFLDSRIRLTDITDGSSNTLLVGERPPGTTESIGWWYGGYGQDKDGSAEVVLGVREYRAGRWAPKGCVPGPYFYGPGRFDNPCDVLHFWSPHAGAGANFLFADGSCHFLPYSANPMMPSLATRAGADFAGEFN